MNIKFFITSVALFFMFYSCQGQTVKEDTNKSNNKMEINKDEIAKKRRADNISIESPVMARLEIEKEKGKLVAVLTFANMSDEVVMVDKNKLGGDKLQEHIFHLNPWYTKPNITFKPYKSSSATITEEYVSMKPQEVIVTRTNLGEYYDFNERKYEIMTIAYSGLMKYLDKDRKQITQKDVDGKIKPVNFYIFSNQVKLDYDKDIKEVSR